ncbi:MAG: hypothetical protein R2851_04630 [Caldilineaceae bacterium]
MVPIACRHVLHESFDESLQDLPLTTQRKAVWAQVLLGTRGRTPIVKGTAGRNARWRRTPVQGNHYYMWWIPQSESPLADATIDISGDLTDGNGGNGADAVNTILVHSVRHHDRTDVNPSAPARSPSTGPCRWPVWTPLRRTEGRQCVLDCGRSGCGHHQRAARKRQDRGAALPAALTSSTCRATAAFFMSRTQQRLKRAAREFVESQYTGGGPDPAGAHPYRHAGRSAPRLDGHLQPGSSSSAKWT